MGTQGSGGALPILIVDDDEDVRETLRLWLRSQGITRVETAADGHEALSFLRRAPEPQLVLLDLQMPRYDGWEFLKAYEDESALHPHVVALMSATEPERLEAAAERYPYFQKPLDFDRLLAFIQLPTPRESSA